MSRITPGNGNEMEMTFGGISARRRRLSSPKIAATSASPHEAAQQADTRALGGRSRADRRAGGAPAFSAPVLVVVGELSFTDLYAAPIGLLNALVAEVARRSRTRALGRLTQLDDLAAARGYLLGGRRAAEV